MILTTEDHIKFKINAISKNKRAQFNLEPNKKNSE